MKTTRIGAKSNSDLRNPASRSIAGIDMFQTLDIFANQNHFDDSVRELLAAADERITDANGFGRSSISGVQVAACKQISQAANAYLANELRIGDFLSLGGLCTAERAWIVMRDTITND